MSITTKWDRILMIGIVFFSVLGIFYVKNTMVHSENLTLRIEVDGKIYQEIPLYTLKETRDIKIHTEYGNNVIQVDSKGAKFTKADCMNQYCVQAGKITKANQISVCLPHKVSIQLISNHTDVDIVSY